MGGWILGGWMGGWMDFGWMDSERQRDQKDDAKLLQSDLEAAGGCKQHIDTDILELVKTHSNILFIH